MKIDIFKLLKTKISNSQTFRPNLRKLYQNSTKFCEFCESRECELEKAYSKINNNFTINIKILL